MASRSLRLGAASLLILAASVATVSAAENLSGIKWTTNLDDPPIGDPTAKKGGTLNDYIGSYPLTFRLFGPNSNDEFAGWNRSYTINFSLVLRHPVTDHWVPWLATAWSVQPDNRTIYYKIDPDARWSDGQPLTADDFVFSYILMQSEHIVDPFYNSYAADHYQSVEKIDAHTLKVVGKYSSWRPLADFDIFPTPKHATKLGPSWVKDTTNEWPLTIGPYRITEAVTGQYVVFSRIKDWWGEGKRYFRGLYNVDKIHLQVISDPDRAFDFFKKGELSYYQVSTARKWATELEFDAVKKGWVHRKRVFVDFPQGLYGFAMNLQKPIFQNRDFRKAIQYMFNFDELNEKLMFNSYYRMVSAFEGSEYENPGLKPYGFDPQRAREHLKMAGFVKRGKDGILVDGRGNRASFTLTYGNKGLERHFTVIKQAFSRFGVEMNLRLLEPGAAFNNELERQYEMCVITRTSGFWPEPHQYFSAEFKKSTNNNNIWCFGTAHTDSLIDIFRFNIDEDRRRKAMYELDAIIQDEAFYLPFWQVPFLRLIYWDQVQWPRFFLPKRQDTPLYDWQVFWIDEAKEGQLKNAMAKGLDLGEDKVVDIDPYGVKAALEAAARAAASSTGGVRANGR